MSPQALSAVEPILATRKHHGLANVVWRIAWIAARNASANFVSALNPSLNSSLQDAKMLSDSLNRMGVFNLTAPNGINIINCLCNITALHPPHQSSPGNVNIFDYGRYVAVGQFL